MFVFLWSWIGKLFSLESALQVSAIPPYIIMRPTNTHAPLDLPIHLSRNYSFYFVIFSISMLKLDDFTVHTPHTNKHTHTHIPGVILEIGNQPTHSTATYPTHSIDEEFKLKNDRYIFFLVHSTSLSLAPSIRAYVSHRFCIYFYLLTVSYYLPCEISVRLIYLPICCTHLSESNGTKIALLWKSRSLERDAVCVSLLLSRRWCCWYSFVLTKAKMEATAENVSSVPTNKKV